MLQTHFYFFLDLIFSILFKSTNNTISSLKVKILSKYGKIHLLPEFILHELTHVGWCLSNLNSCDLFDSNNEFYVHANCLTWSTNEHPKNATSPNTDKIILDSFTRVKQLKRMKKKDILNFRF